MEKYTEKVYDDGVVWIWPWYGVVKYNVQWKKYTIVVPLLTKDELHAKIKISVTLRPNPQELVSIEQEIGQRYYENVVQPNFSTITRSVFSNYLHNEMTVEGPEIEDKILNNLKLKLKGKHILLDKVSIEHLMYSPLVTKAVDRKLATKQAIEQKNYEKEIAEKDAEIQRILAKGQKDAQIIVNKGLTIRYLQFKALEVQNNLAKSPDAKFYFVPIGKDGVPIIIDSSGK